MMPPNDWYPKMLHQQFQQNMQKSGEFCTRHLTYDEFGPIWQCNSCPMAWRPEYAMLRGQNPEVCPMGRKREEETYDT